MDAEEGKEEERVNLADDPSNRAMVQRNFHHLPLDMRLEILSRLSITSLIHFKATSHAGYDLIDNPRLPPMFRNRLSNSNPRLILFGYNFLAFPHWELYFVNSEDCSGRVTKIDPPYSEVNDLVGSCNGLLCLSFPIIGGSSESHSLLIYNPFVGDAVRVPPATQYLNQSEVFGFGFHPRTGEFKVVRIVWYEKIMTVADPELVVEEVNDGFTTVYESMVQVLTVGTSEWREKGALPPQLTDEIGPPEALVEGSLHWVTDVGIISFELADEVFEEIPQPPCQRFVSRDYSLSVLNGCLSAATLVDDFHFDIWVMVQYRVKESWVKQFYFEPHYFGGCRRFYTVICALKNGEILLQKEDNSLVSYDPMENRFKIKTLQISRLTNWFQALPFLPSPFSAKATMNLQL